jgi:hypothetical protein
MLDLETVAGRRLENHLHTARHVNAGSISISDSLRYVVHIQTTGKHPEPWVWTQQQIPSKVLPIEGFAISSPRVNEGITGTSAVTSRSCALVGLHFVAIRSQNSSIVQPRRPCLGMMRSKEPLLPAQRTM